MALAVALQAVTALATPISNEVDIEKRGTGFANAVYFTNWLVTFMFYCFRFRIINERIGASTAVVSSRRTFQPRRSRMCSILS